MKIWKKMNNRGFAISTMLYGLIFVAIAIFYLIIGIVGNRNDNNTNFVDEVRRELNSLQINLQ